MGIPTKAVTNENIEKAKQKAGEQGWELMNIRMLTNHPDDHYLMVTRSYILAKNEYVVGIYNSDMNGFAEGYYTKDKFDSIDKFWDKR